MKKPTHESQPNESKLGKIVVLGMLVAIPLATAAATYVWAQKNKQFSEERLKKRPISQPHQ